MTGISHLVCLIGEQLFDSVVSTLGNSAIVGNYLDKDLIVIFQRRYVVIREKNGGLVCSARST